MKTTKATSGSVTSERKNSKKTANCLNPENLSGSLLQNVKIRTLTVLVSMFVIFIIGSSASAAVYKLTVTDIVSTSVSSLEFSIYLENAGTEDSDFSYSLGQYFLEFNPALTYGAKLNYSILSSDLPEEMRPRNPSVNGNLLRLACNTIKSDKSNLPQISKKNTKILIARMRLETVNGEFTGEPHGLKWAGTDSKFRTKIFAFNGSENTEITSETYHSIESDNYLTTENSLAGAPEKYSISQNYPNPFNPSTTIRYSLPEENFVAITVFDLAGKEVKSLVNEHMQAGNYEVSFNATNLASGMYFYRIQAGKFSQVMKMVLLK